MNLVPLLLAALPTLAFVEDEMPDGDKLVAVTALADHESVQPGGTFTVAVRYAIEKKWHIYWENPGDSGIQTRATLTLPDGWKAGAARFPYPERHEQPGDIVTNVFHDELVLLVDVTVPKDAKPGSKATIGVLGEWLVCQELCVPGSGKASLDVAVADAAKPANEALFQKARTKLPRAWSEFAKARTSWGGTLEEPKLTLIVPGATQLQYFPLDVEPVELASAVVDVGKQGATLRATFEFTKREEKDEPRVRGVVVVTTDAGVAAYRLDHLFTPPPAGR